MPARSFRSRRSPAPPRPGARPLSRCGRARALAPLALAAGLLAAGAPAAAASERVRAFAVGPKLSLSWLESRESFRGKLLALADRRARGPGTPLVQRGADDVASHLLGPRDSRRPARTARDLVVLPEDVGLMAVFTGARGEAARRAGSLEQAIGAVLAAYGDLVGHYAAKYPGLAERPPPPTRLLTLAVTDTFARVGVETFAELADRLDAYLAAGVIMARDWRVVCVDRATYRPPPGAGPCAREDPALVARLRAPDEPARSYAYEATTDETGTMALIFDPHGRLVSKQVKTYLTPPELPGQLDVTPGHVTRALEAVPTPVGRLGVVISKDAWMPDVTARLDHAGVDVLLQPEFFVGTTVRRAGMWAPDNLKASGYSDLLRHPSLQALVLPSLTGDVYEFSADAQSHLAAKPGSPGAPASFGVGQPPAPGLGPVMPWVVPDPLRPDEPMRARRERLGAAGEALPASGDGPACPRPDVPGPCRGGQAEGVVWADLALPSRSRHRTRARRKRGRTPFSTARPIARGGRPQRNVALVGRGGRVWAAFEERRGGRHVVLLARSDDGGRTWQRPRRPAGPVPPRVDQGWPALALGPGGRLWLAWQEERGSAVRVRVTASDDRGRTFAPPRGPAPAPGVRAAVADQRRPAIAGVGGGRAVVAWIDERDRVPGERLPEAGLWLSRLGPGGFAPARRMDATEPVPLARSLDHSWAPALAARGRDVLLSWLDFAGYDWDVYARESRDGGASWGAERVVNDTPAAREALADDPRPAWTRDGPLVAFTDYEQRPSAHRPHRGYDIALAPPGARNRRIDPHGERPLSAFSPALLPLPGGDALVAWQDHARGPADVRVRRMRRDGRLGGVRRVDDAGAAPWNAWRPALARARRHVVAAWEDDRDGPRRVFVARAALRRVP